MGKLPDSRIIALASVGEGLDEDVQVELRPVLAWVFDAEIITVSGIPLPSSNRLADTDRKGLAFCSDHASQLASRSHA
jgi:hypothetical protein